MASDTVSTNSDEADLALSWSGRWSLAHRIMALNILTIILVALSTLYLDVFRNRLSKERSRQTKIEATTTAQALEHVPQENWPQLLASISKSTSSRFRLYGPDGALIVDSWRLSGPTWSSAASARPRAWARGGEAVENTRFSVSVRKSRPSLARQRVRA